MATVMAHAIAEHIKNTLPAEILKCCFHYNEIKINPVSGTGLVSHIYSWLCWSD